MRESSKSRQCARSMEDVQEHGSRQLAGVCVLQGGMITAKGDKAAGKCVLGSMRESEIRAPERVSQSRFARQKPVERNTAQAYGHPQIRKQFQFEIEPRGAVAQFRGGRLVAGWRASPHGSDPESAERHPVIARSCLRLRSKSRRVQYRIQKIAGAVSGERSPCSIRPVRTRRKAQCQYACFCIAERRHGPAPIVPIDIGAAALGGHLCAVCAQARAEGACHDASVQIRKSFGPCHAMHSIDSWRGQTNCEECRVPY